MARTADAIIIGAGVHGASLAFQLARRGLRVLVLEAATLGAGATGRSSGLVRMHYDLEAEAGLAWASFPTFRDWADVVGAGDCGFVRTGFLQLEEADHAERLRSNVAMHQGLGIPSLLVGRDDVARLAPGFAVDDIELAAYEPESGYADPSGTTAGFIAAARARGAELVQGAAVTAIRVESGKVSGVESARGAFDAPMVVDAAGPWAGRIARLVGLELPIETWRHDTAYILRPSEAPAHFPTVIDDVNAMYFRPEGRTMTLVGLEDDSAIGGDPDVDAAAPAPGFAERAVERVCRRVPGLADGRLHSIQRGIDGLTPDQRPIIGAAVDGPAGFYLDCGFSGTGFKLAPAVGAALAERIVDGRSTTADLTPFAPERFAEGRLLHGRLERPIWR